MNHNLEQSVIDALNNSGQIKAIKLLRELRGIGLKEAKEAIDTYLAQKSTSSDGNAKPPKSDNLEQVVIEQLKKNGQVAAIKILRKLRGIGLKEAKDIIDSFLSHHPNFQYAKTSSVNSMVFMMIIGLVLLLTYTFNKP
jgi:ribosomal protein L7/L12